MHPLATKQRREKSYTIVVDEVSKAIVRFIFIAIPVKTVCALLDFWTLFAVFYFIDNYR